MKSFLNLIRSYDWTLSSIVFILCTVGLTAIYSVDLSRGDQLEFFSRQFIAFVIGITVFFVAGRTHITFYESSSKVLYFFSLALLLLVLFFGQTVRGTTGWFRFLGFSFQPAEFAKVALVIFLAFFISRQRRRFDRLMFVVASGIMVAIFMFLILLQPDLGSAAVLGTLWFGLLFISGAKKRYLFAIILAVFVSAIIGWFFLFKDYQKDRILTFVNPEHDPLDSGYNVRQSIIAVGSGQLWGRGLGFGSQSQLHFLPEAQTDFIFAVIAEELGFVGVLLVMVLYSLLLWRLLVNVRRSNDDFGVYVVLGVMLVFFIQIIFNIGAATGLLPVTGLTLPFLSYGGSSLIMNFLLVGIAQSVASSSEDRRHNLST